LAVSPKKADSADARTGRTGLNLMSAAQKTARDDRISAVWIRFCRFFAVLRRTM
jgi:hypothetical protein